MAEQPAWSAASKWWGWGDPEKRASLPPSAVEMLAAEVGPAEPATRVELDQVAMPEARPLPEAVLSTVDPASVLTAHEHRVRRAAGRGYPDLVRLRTGRLDAAPDAVVMPADAGEVAAILEACSRAGVAVVPFGGGTSVVGGVEALAGGHGRVIALDLRRMRAVEVDPVSLTATLGPGLRGPEAEAALRAEGLTIGHFPQSFEYATIGGFAATRSVAGPRVGGD
jgi:alkyldihydroxyacetonephosphate synthase